MTANPTTSGGSANNKRHRGNDDPDHRHSGSSPPPFDHGSNSSGSTVDARTNGEQMDDVVSTNPPVREMVDHASPCVQQRRVELVDLLQEEDRPTTHTIAK